MILATNLAFFLAAVLTKALKRWQTYYATMVFVSFCNLLYNFLCQDYLTWTFQSGSLDNHKLTDLVNTFVLLPCTTILFLDYFPQTRNKKLIYYLGWVTGFSTLEYIWSYFGRITYEHGWNFYWSIGFYFIMFLAIRLHHTKRLIGLLLSAFTVLFLVISFQVPLS